MKPTIDLTLKRDFNKKNDNFFDAIQGHLIMQMTGRKHILPWTNEIRQITNDADLTIQYGGLYKDSDYNNYNCLIVGNKKDRQDFVFRRHLQNNICDRCGKSLEEIPWQKEYGLCKKCSKDMSTNEDKRNERICWITSKISYINNRIPWKGGFRIV